MSLYPSFSSFFPMIVISVIVILALGEDVSWCSTVILINEVVYQVFSIFFYKLAHLLFLQVLFVCRIKVLSHTEIHKHTIHNLDTHICRFSFWTVSFKEPAFCFHEVHSSGLLLVCFLWFMFIFVGFACLLSSKLTNNKATDIFHYSFICQNIISLYLTFMSVGLLSEFSHVMWGDWISITDVVSLSPL